jgi:hypothetical protein
VRPGDPYLSIPYDRLGFEPVQQRFLVGGATMFTLNFVDDTHLLLTFNTHGLIPRLPDAKPDDDDRLVNAELIELPSGNILARTQWHTRDREQYLWPLAHGQFLLRIRNRLTVIDPIHSLATPDPFQQQRFLDLDRRIGYLNLSPGGDLLCVETIPPPVSVVDGPASRTETLIHVYFFRMIYTAEPGQPPHLTAQSAGQLATQRLIRVPATSEGFLDTSRESPGTWLFDFQSHAGKRIELSPYDTTCQPTPFFVSRTEFVAFGCRGSDSKLELSGFNMRGEEPWIQMLSSQQIAPSFASAPDAGRFVFSHILVTGTFYDIDNLSPEELSAQEIMVIQNHDGRILLKVQASPIQRTGQNFDISPDGLSFAVLRADHLDVFHLPPLTAKDQEQVKLAAADMPEKNDARIRLTITRPAAAAPAKADTALTIPVDAPPALPSAPLPQSSPADPAADDDQPRKPPSLYGPDYPNPKKPNPPG